MADIVEFKTKKKVKKPKSLNPLRVIAAFISLLLVALSLIPFLFLLIATIPWMPKKYGERISGPIEELNRALMDMFRMIEGNEKTEENTENR